MNNLLKALILVACVTGCNSIPDSQAERIRDSIVRGIETCEGSIFPEIYYKTRSEFFEKLVKIQTIESRINELTTERNSSNTEEERKNEISKILARLQIERQYAETEKNDLQKSLNSIDKKTPKTQITAEKFVLNMQICFAYTGDGSRPVNPRNPTTEEVKSLLGGEVYFVAIIKDLTEGTEAVKIQSNVIQNLIVSNELSYNYDLFYGSPTEVLEVHIGVFDDDGLDSSRNEQLKVVQQNIGKTLQSFGQESSIPIFTDLWNLVLSIIEYSDPDDTLMVSHIYVTKSKKNGQNVWTLHNNIIKTDNGTIRFYLREYDR